MLRLPWKPVVALLRELPGLAVHWQVGQKGQKMDCHPFVNVRCRMDGGQVPSWDEAASSEMLIFTCLKMLSYFIFELPLGLDTK